MPTFLAAPTFARIGVIAGFILDSGAGLNPTISKGVLFAQGTMYRPGSAPGVGSVAASQISWLWWHAGTGFYWTSTMAPTTAGDAFLGWVRADGTSVVAWSVRRLGSGPEAIPVGGVAGGVVIPIEGGVAGAPAFGVEVSDLDPTVAEITGLTFTDPDTHFGAGTFTFSYTDATAPDYLLSADLTSGASSVSLASAPTTLSAGDYATIGEEIVLCGTASGTTLPITRAQLGSTAASALTGDAVLKVFMRTVTVAVLSPAAVDWSYMQALPDMKLVAVSGFVTNTYGDGAVGTVCLTGTADHGLLLATPAAGASGTAVFNPTANTDFSIPTGNVIVNVVATTRDCAATLPPEASDVVAGSGNTVMVYLAPGSTYNCTISPYSGDTIDTSSTGPTVTPASPVWIGVAT